MRNVILYFGSFNPVHNGHTAVAGWVAEQRLADEVWLVVSPRNPLKSDAGLAPDNDRLKMTQIAVDEQLIDRKVRVSDVEFGMERPSYTIDTLRLLDHQYPNTKFAMLAGADIVPQLPHWKEHEAMLERYRIYVYPREGYEVRDSRVALLDGAPQWDFSSTDVRRTLLEGGDASGMVARGVAEYIEKNGLWQPRTAEAWLAKGLRMNREGRMSEALSAFLRASELDPENAEAKQYIEMLREIFAFHYVDYYNP